MTTNYHTPWEDGVTDYNETDMNAPLGELDAQITQNVSDIDDHDAQITQNASDIDDHTHNLAHSYGPYDIGGSLSGKPDAGAIILRYPAPRIIRFEADMPDSQMMSGVAADAQAVFSLKKNGVEFATATFAAAASEAVIACPSQTDFAIGNILTLVSPGSQDADLENLGWGFAAIRLAETP